MPHSYRSLQRRVVLLIWVRWSHARLGSDQVSQLSSQECLPLPQESACPARGNRGNENSSAYPNGSPSVKGSCANPHASCRGPCFQRGGRTFSREASAAVDICFWGRCPGCRIERTSSIESTSSSPTVHLCDRTSPTSPETSCPQTLAGLPTQQYDH